jgi:uncharacterized membrane protein YeaQ/YmgE (transglycosylase-associated protein family)
VSRCSDVERCNSLIASIIMHTNGQQGIVLNIIVGRWGFIGNI